MPPVVVGAQEQFAVPTSRDEHAEHHISLCAAPIAAISCRKNECCHELPPWGAKAQDVSRHRLWRTLLGETLGLPLDRAHGATATSPPPRPGRRCREPKAISPSPVSAISAAGTRARRCGWLVGRVDSTARICAGSSTTGTGSMRHPQTRSSSPRTSCTVCRAPVAPSWASNSHVFRHMRADERDHPPYPARLPTYAGRRARPAAIPRTSSDICRQTSATGSASAASVSIDG